MYKFEVSISLSPNSVQFALLICDWCISISGCFLQGFEFLDPFVPVFVDNYNEKEMESCIEYYIHKKWIQNEQGRVSCKDDDDNWYKWKQANHIILIDVEYAIRLRVVDFVGL